MGGRRLVAWWITRLLRWCLILWSCSGTLIVARRSLVEPAGWLLILGLLILRWWLAVASGWGIAVKDTAEHFPKLPTKGWQKLRRAHILGLALLRVALLGIALLRVTLLRILRIALWCLAILGRRRNLLRVAIALSKADSRARGEAKQGRYTARKKGAVHVFKDS